MWEHAAIDRDADGLARCLSELESIRSRLSPGATEEHNMCEAATLVASAALTRQESRGGHFRSDFPAARRGWARKHIEW
jgi:L-aspartate oxidase